MMVDNLLEKLDKEITQQTRNGRDTLYLEADDLRALGCDIDEDKKGRTWVDLNYVIPFIKRYKFKQDLKVETTPVQTYKEFIREIKAKEKERDD